MADPFATQPPNLSSPGEEHFSITPDDDTDLPVIPRILYVVATGDVAIHDKNGTAITYPDVPVGKFEFRARRVLEATTATVVGWL